MPLTRQRQKIRQFCAWMILCACLLRFCLAGGPERVRKWLTQPNTLAILTYLETGRYVRFSASSEETLPEKRPFFRESPAPEEKRLSLEGVAIPELTYGCALRPELRELLDKPLDWDLQGEEPRVLILHTHTTESYRKTEEPYEESSRYRTLDPDYNMVAMGVLLKNLLEEAGIRVIHDTAFHDYPSYNSSYVHARKSTEAVLKENPSVCLVLDLHRDALETTAGQIRPRVETEEGSCAQLMLVMGTNAAGQDFDTWQQNLSLGLKLHALLERQTPGIMRPLQLRAQRFNQDLSPGALIVEVGAAGNTRQEAILGVEKLARAIIALAPGTE